MIYLHGGTPSPSSPPYCSLHPFPPLWLDRPSADTVTLPCVGPHRYQRYGAASLDPLPLSAGSRNACWLAPLATTSYSTTRHRL
jgi:hypothetical protein